MQSTMPGYNQQYSQLRSACLAYCTHSCWMSRFPAREVAWPFIALLVVQVKEADDEEGGHGGGGGGVVGVGAQQKALVLVVLEGAHRHLMCHLDVAVALVLVVNHVLEHAVHIRHLETHAEGALAVVLEGEALVGVQHHKLHLNVISLVGLLLVSLILVDVDQELHLVVHTVQGGLLVAADDVMPQGLSTQHAAVLEGPAGNGDCEVTVTGLGECLASGWQLDLRLNESI
mmetsp:Transcript_6253/g.13698  ORF Transcript_6253/g.13698 Transcript_6253/m.13698 type:complete len:230 (-) Transcript_6253:757-1446(-)